MSSLPGDEFTARPALVHPSGERSLLIELHRCPIPPTYAEAFLMDIKRGVDADATEALEEEARPVPPPPVVAPKPTSAGAGIQARSLPQSMAAGGSIASAGLASVESSRAPTPVRSQAGAVPTGLSTGPRKRRVPDPRHAPSTRLFQGERILDALPIGRQPADGKPFVPYIGHCIKVEILCPDNLEDHKKGDPDWKGSFVVVADRERLPLIFRLLLDTGTTVDSWVFCNLGWDSLDLLYGKPQKPLTQVHQDLYYMKNRIYPPPESHIDDDENTGELVYGVKDGATAALRIAQTLVRLRFTTRDKRDVILLPEMPVGAVYGLSADDLERGEEGLLALGRQGNARSAFQPRSPDGTRGVRWESRTLVSLLQQHDMITEETFTIFTDHPLFVKNSPDCIIFGKIYNPGEPRIPDTSAAWTSIPALPGRGHWKVYLKSLVFVANGNTAGGQYNIPVGEEVIIDNGSSQTYLPTRAYSRVTRLLLNRGGSSPVFNDLDEIHLVFASDASPGREEIRVVGQARRFFTSPYLRPDGAHARCVAESKRTHMLGLNFFMTFIVSFEDCRDPNARVLVHPHRFV
ncbi:hypothetical protein AURDEDRAFT_189020 [Auricularia subglabra TFB-10046 SS5]|uniref:Peptidase A1 domain-containing protein n=1 Tax=Auricularia subglabra (strain TFB-10046 / SS5) TaxID=717982 RepID=J0CVD3_AURST|nr:hypothetical protein AURDEDRAFT_189020 [Auricularia subglabra TFB-10046 SS5]